MKISSDTKGENLKIYIDGILHLSVIMDKLQVHSYREKRDWFVIELVTLNGTMISEYDDKTKWMQVLKLIDEIV
jgi:hypothetical protein